MNPEIANHHPSPRAGEAGFTLVEALVAMVVLVVGIIAVANLMVFATSTNSVGNSSTATTALATRELEQLKARTFNELVPGGDLDANDPGYFNEETVPGVGLVLTRWVVEQAAGDPQLRFIRIRSEVLGPLVRGRSRAEFTTFRACTSTTIGCPAP